MIGQKKHAYQSETLSLLTLKSILTEAKKELPPQTQTEQNDSNEELALKLIANMKKEYKKIDVVARATARSNPTLKQEIASLTAQRFARNDIKIEP